MTFRIFVTFVCCLNCVFQVEVDLLFETGLMLHPCEVKAAATAMRNDVASIVKFATIAARDPATRVRPGKVFYGGDEARQFGDHAVVPWTDIDAHCPNEH